MDLDVLRLNQGKILLDFWLIMVYNEITKKEETKMSYWKIMVAINEIAKETEKKGKW